jgi:hypothetical protein
MQHKKQRIAMRFREKPTDSSEGETSVHAARDCAHEPVCKQRFIFRTGGDDQEALLPEATSGGDDSAATGENVALIPESEPTPASAPETGLDHRASAPADQPAPCRDTVLPAGWTLYQCDHRGDLSRFATWGWRAVNTTSGEMTAHAPYQDRAIAAAWKVVAQDDFHDMQEEGQQ